MIRLFTMFFCFIMSFCLFILGKIIYEMDFLLAQIILFVSACFFIIPILKNMEVNYESRN